MLQLVGRRSLRAALLAGLSLALVGVPGLSEAATGRSSSRTTTKSATQKKKTTTTP